MKKISLTLILLSFLSACGEDPIPSPEAAKLQSPDNLNTCTTAQSVNSLQSRVTFSWLEANNTETYDVVVRNQTTGIEQSNNGIITFETSFVLDKGAPYSWWVNSKSTVSTDVTKSSVWSFYIEGIETSTYIPFPATLLDPAMDAALDLSNSQNYTFEWQGNDLDDDIDYYTLQLGTDANNLSTVAGNISGMTTDVTLQAGSTYFWQIITVDLEGSSSTSQMGTFTTE